MSKKGNPIVRFVKATIRGYAVVSSFLVILLAAGLVYLWMVGAVNPEKASRMVRMMNNRTYWTPVNVDQTRMSPETRAQLDDMMSRSARIDLTLPMTKEEEYKLLDFLARNNLEALLVSRLPADVGREIRELHERQLMELANRRDELSTLERVFLSLQSQVDAEREKFSALQEEHDARMAEWQAKIDGENAQRESLAFERILQAMEMMGPDDAARTLLAQRASENDPLNTTLVVQLLQEITTFQRGEVLTSLREIREEANQPGLGAAQLGAIGASTQEQADARVREIDAVLYRMGVGNPVAGQ